MAEPQVAAISEALDRISWETRSLARSLSADLLVLVVVALMSGVGMSGEIKKLQKQMTEIELRQTERSVGSTPPAQSTSMS